MIILHEFLLSSASYRVRIALNLKGIEYEARSYKLRAGEQRSAEYLKLNPAGLVPTLEIDGQTLVQSLAMIEYLDTRYPEPAFLPQDPAERARIQAIAQTIACDIHPVNNLRVLQYLEHELGQDEEAINKWYATWVQSGFDGVEALLAQAPDRPFAAGEEPGLAEICIVPQLFNARRFKVPLEQYPLTLAVAERASALPAFKKAAEGMPPV